MKNKGSFKGHTAYRTGTAYKRLAQPAATKKESNPKPDDKKTPILTDDINENEGFAGWLSSEDGTTTMKMFVVANSVVMLITLGWPYLYQLFNYIHDSDENSPMFSVQALVVLVIVAWYSLIVLKSTNSYYKEAFKKHIDRESQKYEKSIVKKINVKKDTAAANQVDVNMKIVDNDISDKIEKDVCHKDEDVDVCSVSSKEALVYEQLYKNHP